MKISIRKAKTSEAAQLSTIAFAAKKQWGYPEQWMKLWADGLVITAEFIKNNHVWVVQEDNEIVGFVAVCITGSIAELEHLWVMPNQMKKGVGKALFNQVLSYCKLNSIEKLRIESDPNTRVFYEKMGALFVGYIGSTPKPRRLPVLELLL